VFLVSKFLSAREGLFCRPRARLLALLLVSLLLAGPVWPVYAENDPEGEEDVIVVTATRLPQPAREVPAAVAIVPVEEARAAGATTVGEAVRLVPAAAINAHGGLGSAATANFQGASSVQVQVLVDGRPITTALGPVDLGLLPLTGVERIEVVQGPVSAVYGANALGGVINIITRHPSEQQESLLALSAGGFGARQVAWSTGMDLGWGKGLIAASAEASQGWRANSDASLQALTARVGWTAPGGEATLNARFTKAEAGSPGGDGTYLYSDPTPLARRNDEAAHLDLAYRGDGTGRPQARLYYTDAAWSYTDPAWAEYSRHHGVLGGVEVQRTWEVGAQRILLGGEYRWDSGTSTNFSGPRTATNLGLYIEDLYPVGSWSLTLGGRMDAHSAYGQVLSPRVGAVRRLGEGQRLWFSLARAFRAPSFQDLYWEDPTWGMYGTPDLRPETATAYQVGLTAGPLDLGFFYKDVVDNITWIWDPVTWETRPTNLSAASFQGLELTWRRPLGRWATVETAYTLLNAANAGTGKRLPKRPAARGSVKLGVTAPGAWTGAVTLTTVGHAYYDEANTIVAPGFTKVDLSLARDVNSSLAWRINLDNALNAVYQEVPGYPMPGANLTAGLTYRF
jgi:outer membrane receptor for ferrienterochelin and colicins